MKHIMLDLETMGTSPNAAIVSIGAVVVDFERGCLGDEFYRRINLESSVHSGGVVDPATIIWWLRQGEVARREIYSASAYINKCCLDFNDFINSFSTEDNVCIWGDGASFDNVILSCTYNRLKINKPWKYWNDRCYRTIKNIYKEIKSNSYGTAHNALDDAKQQALHLLEIYKKHPEVNA